MNAKEVVKKPAERKKWDLDDKSDKDMYDDMLDEFYDKFMGQYDPSQVLEEIDPIAYRCGFNDWADSLDPIWICPECGEEHDDEDDAINCCQPDMWKCSECGKEFDDEQDADDCCSEDDDS